MRHPRRADQVEHDSPVSTPRRRRGGGDGGAPEAVRVRMLGGFSVSVGSRTIEEGQWRLRKAASLIKLLALAPYHRMHREQLMEWLWPDLGKEAAANNLHHALHVARGVLDPASATASSSRYLRLRDEILALCPSGPLWVDAEAFEEEAAAARRAREPAPYRAALDLYAGELLPEDRYEEWTEERREALRRTYLSLLLELAALYEEREEYGPAIEALGRVLKEEPTHEEAHLGLMRLYALGGQRGEAIKQYDRLEESLSRDLGTEPDAYSRHLHEEIAAGRFQPSHPPRRERQIEERNGTNRHNLPASRTNFVGREHELVEVKRELAITRLLTFTGVGGSGKTRLALELARELVGTYPDGVWLVELAALSEGALVPQALARVLKVREQPGQPLETTLMAALKTKKLLLLVDNCEHLVEAVACLVGRFLDACPRLRVLATSREALSVEGEIVWPVFPLALPDPKRPYTPEGLLGCESARLFVERASRRPTSFALTPENVGAVAQICRKLDGIPLAIELAAAMVGVLSVEQISARLDDALGLLTGGARTAPPRHKTLRRVLDWSYELLSGPEKKLFEQLSVFADGWTLEAAETVVPGGSIEEGRALDLLSRLVEKSLVTVETEGAPRYRMLEPVRQYARERLEESGEADNIRRRHAAWVLALAKEAEPWLRTPRQGEWLGRLDEEDDNLRAALGWAFRSGETEVGLQLAVALGDFWILLGRLEEGHRWLEAALAGDKPPTSVRVKVLVRAGHIAWEQRNFERSVALSEEALALSRASGDEAGVAAALHNLGVVAMFRNENEKAEALVEEAIQLQRKLGDMVGLSFSLHALGLTVMAKGEFGRAAALQRENLVLARKMGDERMLGFAIGLGALIALGEDDYEGVQTLGLEALKIYRRMGYRHYIPPFLGMLAAVAGGQGYSVRSARLYGASEALYEAIGARSSSSERAYFGRHLKTARAQLGEEAWEKAWAEGQAMTQEEAIEYALSEVEPASLTVAASEQPPADKPSDDLTRREREVALLVGRGLTNRQIAKELLISKRTVDNHVANILKKLDLPSRDQLTAYSSSWL